MKLYVEKYYIAITWNNEDDHLGLGWWKGS